jgi:exportin-2 (importin alpha re-exporter)
VGSRHSQQDLRNFSKEVIQPELRNSSPANNPVIKATVIRFVCTARYRFTGHNPIKLLHLLIRHLNSNEVVVHTFAACAIERILVCNGNAEGAKRLQFGAQELMPHLEPLLNRLFSIIDTAEHNENHYAMKCIMWSLATAKDGIIPLTQDVITKLITNLTTTLERIGTNQHNPQYNHYLFESIAILVRSVCSKDPNQTAAFEQFLGKPFAIVLGTEIADFDLHYVYQLMAQLLEYRPADHGLGPKYMGCFDSIITPVFWKKKRNVPALTWLLQAYVRKAPTELLPYLDGILVVFEMLLLSESTECSAFDVLSVSTAHFPHDAMDPKIGTVFQILLVRLQGSTKAPRYKKLVTTYFALFVGKYGPQVFVERLEGVQPGLAVMVLEQVWIPRLVTEPPIHAWVETKVHVVGLTKLLFESPVFRGRHQAWIDTLTGVVALLTSPVWLAGTNCAAGASLGYEMDGDDAELENGYDAQFSKLTFASRTPEDFFPEAPKALRAFCLSLYQALESPSPILHLVQTTVNADRDMYGKLKKMMKKEGLKLVGIRAPRAAA